jgi:Recombination endonuclease VII
MSESNDTAPDKFRLEGPPSWGAVQRARKRAYYAKPAVKTDRKAKRDAYRAKPGIKERERELERMRFSTSEGKVKQFYRNVKQKYGLDRHEIDEMIKACEGRCPCCKAPLSKICGGMAGPAVDHDHSVGKGRKSVRGIVCKRCNLVLGHASDQPGILQACARHLRRLKSSP